jgi:hypothetical protein
MQLIPVTSKDVKFINDINQVVKKSFLHYFVVRNGVAFTNMESRAMDNGIHFSFIENIERLKELIPIPERYAVKLSSAAIYTTIKDNKKHLKHIKIENDQVFLQIENDFVLIGEYVLVEEEVHNNYAGAVFRMQKKEDITLLDSTIEAMLNNEIVTHSDGENKIRITKSLFPHIKVGVPISITFLNLDDPSLFEAMVSITKDNVTNFHVYTCIKF